MIEFLRTKAWQMTFSERAALEGVLSQLKPQLAVEIGTAEGGSLRRIATHSVEVHSFDLVEPEAAVRDLPNVTLHTGDSHVMLAEFLDHLAGAGGRVDFALVDGDHTAEGVRQDLEALLTAEAVQRCVILIHDTANDVVRGGLERVSYGSYPAVSHHDLDFLPGHLSSGGPYHHQLWGGLGLVVVDRETPGGGETGFYSSFEIFAAVRDALVLAEGSGRPASPREVVRLQAGDPSPDLRAEDRGLGLSAELERTRAVLDSVVSSASWRATAPLRSLARSIRTRRASRA